MLDSRILFANMLKRRIKLMIIISTILFTTAFTRVSARHTSAFVLQPHVYSSSRPLDHFQIKTIVKPATTNTFTTTTTSTTTSTTSLPSSPLSNLPRLLSLPPSPNSNLITLILLSYLAQTASALSSLLISSPSPFTVPLNRRFSVPTSGPLCSDLTFVPSLSSLQPHRYLTSFLVHGNLLHLAFNLSSMKNLPSYLPFTVSPGAYVTTFLLGERARLNPTTPLKTR